VTCQVINDFGLSMMQQSFNSDSHRCM